MASEAGREGRHASDAVSRVGRPEGAPAAATSVEIFAGTAVGFAANAPDGQVARVAATGGGSGAPEPLALKLPTRKPNSAAGA